MGRLVGLAVTVDGRAVSLVLSAGVSLALGLPAQAQVGLRELSRPGLPITVLYPTDQAGQKLTRGPIEIEAAPDAPPLPGPHKVVLLSHGSAGSPLADHGLARTLVRAGFVVAQPLHRGDNFRDFSQAGPNSWRTRPAELSETLDALGRDPVLGPTVLTDRVGVHGMSAGGGSALALAGAQWSMGQLIAHCAAHLDEDIGFCLQGLAQHPLQRLLRRSQFALARMMPPDRWPSSWGLAQGGLDGPELRPDPRMAAVSLLVPVGAIFSPESLGRIRIPVGLTVAEDDQVLLPQFHSGHVLRHCASCRILSSQPSGHFDWLWPWPDALARQVAATQMRGGLPRTDFTPSQRQAAFERIARFFLEALP